MNWRLSYDFDETLNSFEIYNVFFGSRTNYYRYKPSARWIPYSQITNLEKIAEGGFSIIYKARWCHLNRVKECYKKTVAIKRFRNSWDMDKYFLNEVNSVLMIFFNVFLIITLITISCF